MHVHEWPLFPRNGSQPPRHGVSIVTLRGSPGRTASSRIAVAALTQGTFVGLALTAKKVVGFEAACIFPQFFLEKLLRQTYASALPEWRSTVEGEP
jgi:hypothetical protein